MANATEAPGMLYRTLGSTGEKVSAIGVGGWHLGLPKVDEQLAIRLVRTAVDRGITFMDNCWDYHEGASEIRMGKALREGYRERVFLMTKIDGRSKQEAARQLDESLRRLRVEMIDLVQHHEVLRFEDPHRIFDDEGANAALVEAKKAGKLRYIGFTGHKDPQGPSLHAEGGGGAWLRLRRGPDAAQRDGCPFPEFRKRGAAGTGPAENRASSG